MFVQTGVAENESKWLQIASESRGKKADEEAQGSDDPWLTVARGGSSSESHPVEQLPTNPEDLFSPQLGGAYPIKTVHLLPLLNFLTQIGEEGLAEKAQDGIVSQDEKATILSEIKAKNATAQQLPGGSGSVVPGLSDALANLSAIFPQADGSELLSPAGDTRRVESALGLATFLADNGFGDLAEAIKAGPITQRQYKLIETALTDLKNDGVQLPLGVAADVIAGAQWLADAEWSSETEAPGEKFYTFQTDSPEGRALMQFIEKYGEDFQDNAHGTLDDDLLSKIRSGKPLSEEEYRKALDGIWDNFDDHSHDDYVLGETTEGKKIEVLGVSWNEDRALEGRLVEVVGDGVYWVRGGLQPESDNRYNKDYFVKFEAPKWGNKDLEMPELPGLTQTKTRGEIYGEVTVEGKYAKDLVQFLESLPDPSPSLVEAVEINRLTTEQRDEIQKLIRDYSDRKLVGP